MEYRCIAKIINTHGIKGELKLDIYTDFITSRFKKDSCIYFGDEKLEFIVKSYRIHKGFLLLTLNGITNINEVEKYKNMYVYKNEKDIEKLVSGEFFAKDLIGLNAYFENIKIGIIKDIEENDRYKLFLLELLNKQCILVPHIDVFIESIDIKNKIVNFKNLKGLV